MMEEVMGSAPRLNFGGVAVADLRGFAPPQEGGKFDQGAFPGLQPVAFKMGVAYLALIRTRTGDPDGSLKVVLGGCDPVLPSHQEAVGAFKKAAEGETGLRKVSGVCRGLRLGQKRISLSPCSERS